MFPAYVKSAYNILKRHWYYNDERYYMIFTFILIVGVFVASLIALGNAIKNSEISMDAYNDLYAMKNVADIDNEITIAFEDHKITVGEYYSIKQRYKDIIKEKILKGGGNDNR